MVISVEITSQAFICTQDSRIHTLPYLHLTGSKEVEVVARQVSQYLFDSDDVIRGVAARLELHKRAFMGSHEQYVLTIGTFEKFIRYRIERELLSPEQNEKAVALSNAIRARNAELVAAHSTFDEAHVKGEASGSGADVTPIEPVQVGSLRLSQLLVPPTVECLHPEVYLGEHGAYPGVYVICVGIDPVTGNYIMKYGYAQEGLRNRINTHRSTYSHAQVLMYAALQMTHGAKLLENDMDDIVARFVVSMQTGSETSRRELREHYAEPSIEFPVMARLFDMIKWHDSSIRYAVMLTPDMTDRIVFEGTSVNMRLELARIQADADADAEVRKHQTMIDAVTSLFQNASDEAKLNALRWAFGASPTEPSTEPTQVVCDNPGCGRSFKDMRGMRRHKREFCKCATTQV